MKSEPALNTKRIPCLQRKHWERPTPQPQGDLNVDPVFTAVGRALTQWEKFKQQLATLFLVLCNASGSSNSSVRRAYGAIENTTLRRKAILAAAEVHFESRGTTRPKTQPFAKLSGKWTKRCLSLGACVTT